MKKEFEKKYEREIILMAKSQDVDMGVAREMLIAHVKNRAIDTPYKYNFDGQETLNYEELDKDILGMELIAFQLREQQGFN